MAMLAKSYLIDAKPVQVAQDKVVIGFDPEFASKREAMNLPRNIQAVQKALSDVLKRQVSVSFTILGAEETRSLPADKPQPARPSAVSAEPAQGSQDKKNRQQWTQDPAVKRALEAFNGDIIDIRE
jgi:hypothetical protein